MKLYNTLTKTIDKFVPNDAKQVNLYTCGPTVYNYAHIGNLRCYIMEDILKKTLVYLGYEVNHVMNITDVGHLTSDADTGDDKMLVGAKREHKTVLELAKYYTECFFNDCNKLNIQKPTIVAPATEHISNYIQIISRLISTGYAYIAGGNVYFDTSKLEKYYVLTNYVEEDLIVGARDSVEADLNKRNKADFVLWFTKSKFDDQELKWDSPWGTGYPGWHIECSGISLQYCGEYLDIHCGGVDNAFPHHTNEIAQSESYLGHKWCNYWFHVEHLNNDTGKMSKSSGEFLKLDVLENKGYNPIVYRFFCLLSHYRKQLVFSWVALDNAKIAYTKLKNKVLSLNPDGEFDLSDYSTYKQKFMEAIADDLNTSSAITILYDALKSDINDATKIKLVADFDEVLSLDLLKTDTLEIPTEIMAMVEERNTAKNTKDYAKADSLRADIEAAGYKLIDTKEGTKVERV